MALLFGNDVIQISTDGGSNWTDLPPTTHRTPPLYRTILDKEYYEDLNGNFRKNDNRFVFEMTTEWGFMQDSDFQFLYDLWKNQWSKEILMRPHKDNASLQYEVKIASFEYAYIKAMVGWQVKITWRSVGEVTRP